MIVVAHTYQPGEFGNEWERRWGYDANGYYSQRIDHGVYSKPVEYLTRGQWRKAFDLERATSCSRVLHGLTATLPCVGPQREHRARRAQPEPVATPIGQTA